MELVAAVEVSDRFFAVKGDCADDAILRGRGKTLRKSLEELPACRQGGGCLLGNSHVLREELNDEIGQGETCLIGESCGVRGFVYAV